MTHLIQQAIQQSAAHLAQGIVTAGAAVGVFFLVLGLALWANR